MKTKRLVAIGIKRKGEKNFKIKSLHKRIFNGEESGDAIIDFYNDGEGWIGEIKTIESTIK